MTAIDAVAKLAVEGEIATPWARLAAGKRALWSTSGTGSNAASKPPRRTPASRRSRWFAPAAPSAGDISEFGKPHRPPHSPAGHCRVGDFYLSTAAWARKPTILGSCDNALRRLVDNPERAGVVVMTRPPIGGNAPPYRGDPTLAA